MSRCSVHASEHSSGGQFLNKISNLFFSWMSIKQQISFNKKSKCNCELNAGSTILETVSLTWF